MMFHRRPLLPAFLATCAVLASEASAAPAAVLLESTSTPGAADCPGAAALAGVVNDGLGRVGLVTARSGGAPRTAGPANPLRVAVTFERVAEGYAATVNIGDGRGGTRRLSDRGPGCDALASAVGLLLAVVLDSSPEILASAAASPPAPTPPPSPPPATSPPAPRSPTTADVSVGGGVAQGLVGGWSPAVGLGGTLAYRRLAARLGGFWLPAKSNAYGPGRVEVGLAAARLALCVSVPGGGSRLTLGLCAQQQVGWMRGRGVDYEASNRSADHLWLATGASLVARGPLAPWLGWELEVGAVRLLQQERFVIDNLGTAFRSDPVAFLTTLAFTTRVW